MSGTSLFKGHRTWEDWLGIGIGALIVLTPAMAGEAESFLVVQNTALVGIMILSLAAFEMVSLRRWEEVGEAALGLWLIASPFVFGYAQHGTLRYWHFILGALVVVIALLELWQDRGLSETELQQHGNTHS